MNRRGFLGAILAAASAPAIVRAESLMPTRSGILVPERPEILRPPVIGIDETIRSGFILSLGPGLKLGDIVTIAGVAGSFVVHKVQEGSGLVNLTPSSFPAMPFHADRFRELD